MRLQLVMAHIEIAAEAMCPSAGDHHARTAKPVKTFRPPPMVLWEGQLRLVHGIDDDAEHATFASAKTIACANRSVYHDIGPSGVHAIAEHSGASPQECHCLCARTLNTGSRFCTGNVASTCGSAVHVANGPLIGARRYSSLDRGRCPR